VPGAASSICGMRRAVLWNASWASAAARRDAQRPDGGAQAIDTLCRAWAHALAWNVSRDRLAKTLGLDPIEFERACHDEAWGCASSRVWRAYLEVGRMVA